MEVIESYKYREVHFDNRLVWKSNTKAVYSKCNFLCNDLLGQSHWQKLNNLIKAGSVLGTALEPLELVVGERILHKL